MVKTALCLLVLTLAAVPACGGDTDDDGGSTACRPGETKTESCNTCTCTGAGEWGCTRLACTCTDGETRPADDGCNTCTCNAGQWGCTELACPAGRACGARAGQTCSATEYCAYVEGGLCGAADGEATCQPRPSSCDDVYAPVCACDGTTYGNACEAARAGSGVNTSGECR